MAFELLELPMVELGLAVDPVELDAELLVPGALLVLDLFEPQIPVVFPVELEAVIFLLASAFAVVKAALASLRQTALSFPVRSSQRSFATSY